MLDSITSILFTLVMLNSFSMLDITAVVTLSVSLHDICSFCISCKINIEDAYLSILKVNIIRTCVDSFIYIDDDNRKNARRGMQCNKYLSYITGKCLMGW